MKIEIYEFKMNVINGEVVHNTTPDHCGYIDIDFEVFNEDVAEECWEICNWSHWTESKPDQLHSDIDSCNHGIVFQVGNKNYLSLSDGWLCGGSTEITDYVRKNKNRLLWSKHNERMI